MNLVAEGLLFALIVVAAAPVLLLLLQVAGALRTARGTALAPTAAALPASVAVLMPAHDEAEGVGRTIESILPQLRDTDRLVVVADNCSDETAKRAREAGATVLERHDAQRRGKGYALAFGMQRLAAAAPDVVILIDADCTVGADAIPLLAAQANLHQRPIQAHYRMEAPQGAGRMSKVSAFAWRFKTLVRPLGYRALGLPCQLMGSGMAFPWPLLVRFDLGDAHLVEDLKLGIDLARAGAAPRFEPAAEIVSSLPPSSGGARKQRTRWEHGHLGMMLSTAPRLVVQGLHTRSLTLLAVAADLCVPPLALFAVLLWAVTAAAVVGWWWLGWLAPMRLAVAVSATFLLVILTAWARFGRDTITAGELATAPLYVLWKIPVYVHFLLRRERSWVRTERGAKQ
jgi:cellulose synthase/poly-beta-1,6-N-acetylglucosamine synthase-like glycosyltransferase